MGFRDKGHRLLAIRAGGIKDGAYLYRSQIFARLMTMREDN